MNYKRVFVILLILILIITGVIFFMKHYNKKLVWSVSQGEKPLTNPLKGWAVWGANSSYKQDVTLAYISIKWSELEQQKGVYDFDTIENNFNMDEWKSKNARFIIRFICDYPEDKEGNMTIPQWLYDEMGGDGQHYDNDYGIGFAPDYTNEVLIAAHEKAIKALGARYNEDPYVAYIQLGSIGHWGEWHVNYGEGINKLPKANVLDQYVQPYMDYLSDKMPAIRKPTAIACEYGFGLYNDVFGDKEATDIWLDRIANGYESDQTDENMPGMPRFWETAVSGGEISSRNPLEYYISEGFDETFREIEDCHTTFLGPKAPYGFEKGCEYQDNIDKITARMGYCFTINKVLIENLYKRKDLNITLSWENIGVSPIYQNWPVCISIAGSDGTEYAKEIADSNMTEWVSGTYDVKYKIKNTNKLPKGEYKILVSILEPITNVPGIALALDDEEGKLVYNVGEFSK
jgi:hypothetical protein